MPIVPITSGADAVIAHSPGIAARRARAMLFPKAILKAEWDAAAPLRDALTIRRERWRRLRSEKGKMAAP
jgi:hypothetical protein